MITPLGTDSGISTYSSYLEKELKKLVDNKKYDPEIIEEAQNIILKLVYADKLLAEKAIENGYGKAKDLEKAQREYDKGLVEIDNGDYEKAIDKFKKAWEYASKCKGGALTGAAIIDVFQENTWLGLIISGISLIIFLVIAFNKFSGK